MPQNKSYIDFNKALSILIKKIPSLLHCVDANLLIVVLIKKITDSLMLCKAYCKQSRPIKAYMTPGIL